MKEAEWNACDDPQPMLEFLRGKGSDRKLRLFAVACCRRVWDWMREAASRNAVVVVEQFADGHASNDEVKAARDIAWDVMGLPCQDDPDTRPPVGSWYAARAACGDTDDPLYTAWAAGAAVATGGTRWDDPAWGQFLFAAWVRYHEDFADRFWDDFFWEAPFELGWDDFLTFSGWIAERKEQASLLRCIFGPLSFRIVLIDPAWLTTNLKQLAEAIYESKEFRRLPILADALEEAGCHDADILGHCRGPGPHIRGCWVIDILLGKE